MQGLKQPIILTVGVAGLCIGVVGIAAVMRVLPFQSVSIQPREPQLLVAASGHLGLTFDDPERDLGGIAKPVTTLFSFRNLTGKPVRVSKLSPSCSCEALRLAKRSYDPGEGGEIKVTIDPARQPTGVRSFSVRVDYEDPDLPPAFLRLKARVGGQVQLQASVSLRQIGTDPASTTFSLVDFRPKHLEVRRVTADDARLRVETLLVLRIYQSGWRWLFRVSAGGPGSKAGGFNAAVRLETNDPQHSTLATRVSVESVPRLRVAPKVVVLTRPAGGSHTTWQGQIIVDDRKGLPVQIGAVISSDRCLSAQYSKSPLLVQVIGFRLELNPKQGLAKPITIRLALNSPVREEICVKAVCSR